MPKATQGDRLHRRGAPGYEGRFQQLGEHTVGFERFEEAVDAAPLFQGLPDDRCQSPHWGIVVKGSITFRYADHEETIDAGEAYYAAPGHTPVLAAGTEVIEFSPTAQLQARRWRSSAATPPRRSAHARRLRATAIASGLESTRT